MKNILRTVLKLMIIIPLLGVIGIYSVDLFEKHFKENEPIVLVVPQKPGSGTSVWAQIVAEQLGPYLEGRDIIIKHIPGARDIPGFNEFHNTLRYDDNHVMVSHGGNGVSFLQENVDYDYRDYESVGLMNLNIIVGKLKGTDGNNPSFAAGSGMVPEAYAITLLLCGPNMTLEEYGQCFVDHVTWVNGMSGSERRLAFKRGELNATRENPAAYKKHVESNEEAELWFHHGILDWVSGKHLDDPNYPGFQLEELYFQRWGMYPDDPMMKPEAKEFYAAYKLVKSWRDGVQKALWVNKGNPNLELLRTALQNMANDPEAMAAIEAKVGKYEWVIGEAGNQQRDALFRLIGNSTLNTLVFFNNYVLGLTSVFKPDLVLDNLIENQEQI